MNWAPAILREINKTSYYWYASFWLFYSLFWSKKKSLCLLNYYLCTILLIRYNKHFYIFEIHCALLECFLFNVLRSICITLLIHINIEPVPYCSESDYRLKCSFIKFWTHEQNTFQCIFFNFRVSITYLHHCLLLWYLHHIFAPAIFCDISEGR